MSVKTAIIGETIEQGSDVLEEAVPSKSGDSAQTLVDIPFQVLVNEHLDGYVIKQVGIKVRALLDDRSIAPSDHDTTFWRLYEEALVAGAGDLGNRIAVNGGFSMAMLNDMPSIALNAIRTASKVLNLMGKVLDVQLQGSVAAVPA